MALVLDTGALIAIDRRNRALGALLRVAQRNALPVRTSTAAVAQVWRDGSRQANLARVLAGVDQGDLDRPAARKVGELLGPSSTADVVDGHVALVTASGDHLLTSDPDDLAHLLETRQVEATITAV